MTTMDNRKHITLTHTLYANDIVHVVCSVRRRINRNLLWESFNSTSESSSFISGVLLPFSFSHRELLLLPLTSQVRL